MLFLFSIEPKIRSETRWKRSIDLDIEELLDDSYVLNTEEAKELLLQGANGKHFLKSVKQNELKFSENFPVW